jgi:hypothetical protein
MIFDTPGESESSSGSDGLNVLLDGIKALAEIAEFATGGQITLDVASTKALTTPTEKWVFEIEEDSWVIHHAGVSEVVYGADTLSSSETGKVYSEYEKIEEVFVVWENVHHETICVFENKADFVRGLKFLLSGQLIDTAGT